MRNTDDYVPHPRSASAELHGEGETHWIVLAALSIQIVVLLTLIGAVGYLGYLVVTGASL